MPKSVRIYFIYAEKCEHCKSALIAIKNATNKSKKITCEIIKLKYNTKAAIGIAATQGIDELPGFLVGDTVFQGSDYSEKRIIDAINKASK